MDEKVKKLIEYGEKAYNQLKSDTNDLQNYVENVLDLNELINVVPEIIWKFEDAQMLDYIFLGLSHHPSSQKKCMKVIECVLSNFHEKEATNKTMVAFMSKICIQLEKLSTIDLMKICNICINNIQQTKSSSSVAWKEILPKVLHLLAEKKEVNHSGSEMSGEEYKSEVIKSLCLLDWELRIITPIASMFFDMPLNNEEHEKVVRKFCGYFDELDPQELPPLVHQLLQLCKEDHSVIVFIHLKNYFFKHLHSKPVNAGSDIEITADRNRIQAESTILCHIEEFARISRIGDLNKLCKNSINAADYILDPFLLAILLTLSCIPAYEAQTLDVLKSMLTRVILEENKLQDSSWLHNIVNSDVKAEHIFSKLIHSRIGEHDKILKGLINLAFLMLASYPLKGKEMVAKKMWNIARALLVSVVKRHRQVTKSVLQTLADRIITGSSFHQYTDCLFHLCNVSTLSVLDNLPIVIRILEFINQVPNTTAQHVIIAVLPLVRISNRLRDNLILILRKALFSRQAGTRQVAVVGFLKLLRFLKLQGLSTLSQNSLCQNTISGPSVFTQLCMDLHSQQATGSQRNTNTNVAICLEIIGILKRCFSLKASVKVSLYAGLFDAISVNPEICLGILDVLLIHVSQYYISDTATLPGLEFSKIVTIHGIDVVLQEPLGRLLLLIQDVLVKSANVFNGEENMPRSCAKLTGMLKSLVERFSTCDLNHFDLNEDVNLTDVVPESAVSREIINQILAVYESLISYMINSWNLDYTAESETQLILLHKKYTLVKEFAENSNKSNRKKDGNEDKRNKKSQKNDLNGVLIKKVSFKLDSSILRFVTIHRLLRIYLDTKLEWMSASSQSEIKRRKHLFSYAAQSLLDVIFQIKIKLNEEYKSSTIFSDITLLSRLLFEKCLSCYNEIYDYERSAAITCLQCFSELLDLVYTFYHSKFSEFLQSTVLVSVEDELMVQISPIVDVYKNLLEKAINSDDSSNLTDDNADTEETNTSKSLMIMSLKGLSNLVKIIPTNDQLTFEVLDWLMLIAEKHSFNNVNNTKIFIQLLLMLTNKCKTDLTLLDSMVAQLCHTFPSINDTVGDAAVRPLMIITSENKNAVLQLVCSTLITHLEDVEWAIVRFKSEHFIIPYVELKSKDYAGVLRKKEKELCQRLTHIALMTKSISAIAIPTGQSMEIVFKLITNTYSVISLLTKYFTVRSSSSNPAYQYALYNKLVKVAGTHLSSQVAELIIFVESYEFDKKVRNKRVSSQIRRQGVLIPKVVSTLENFTKLVTLLSKKCKDTSLMSNVKLTIARDFRLSMRKLEEVINKQNEESESEDNNSTTNNDNSRDASSSTSSAPQPKRRRKMS